MEGEPQHDISDVPDPSDAPADAVAGLSARHRATNDARIRWQREAFAQRVALIKTRALALSSKLASQSADAAYKSSTFMHLHCSPITCARFSLCAVLQHSSSFRFCIWSWALLEAPLHYAIPVLSSSILEDTTTTPFSFRKVPNTFIDRAAHGPKSVTHVSCTLIKKRSLSVQDMGGVRVRTLAEDVLEATSSLL